MYKSINSEVLVLKNVYNLAQFMFEVNLSINLHIKLSQSYTVCEDEDVPIGFLFDKGFEFLPQW